MTTLDQFDVFVNNDYSGSYTDNIVQVFSGSQITDRKNIGSNNNNSIYNFSFETRYSDYIGYVSGNKSGKNNNFVGFLDLNELYFDSLVASPADYHITNGAELLSSPIRLSGSTILNIDNFVSGSAFSLRLATPNVPVLNVTYSSNTYKVNDSDWTTSFPFEKKYSNLIRLQKISNFLPKNYSLRLAIDENNNALGGDIRALAVTKSSNIFTGEITYLERSQEEIVSESDGFAINMLSDVSKSFAEQHFLTFSGSAYSGSAGTKFKEYTTAYGTFSFIPPSLIDSYKFYFGTGRKKTYTVEYDSSIRKIVLSDKMPEFIDNQGFPAQPSSQLTLVVFNRVFGVNIAGWKYGLVSALPTNTKTIFRRNKYGQFRDMLEQRQYSKFLIKQKNTTTKGICDITFVSGSDAYVTSSNDSTLNIKDSGMFRKNYSSGKPFTDNI